VATIIGTNGDDTLVGTKDADLIIGLLGRDDITGGTGDDQIDAGDGDDIISWKAGDGSDLIDGGTGDDQVLLDNLALHGETYAIRSGADPHDIVVSEPATDGAELTLNGIERLFVTGSPGDDSFTVGDLGRTGLVPGGDDRFEIYGDGGNDRFDAHAARVGVFVSGAGDASIAAIGGGGSDWLIGSDGNDVLHGNGGGDELESGRGNDVLDGGVGDDSIWLAAGHDRVTLGKGADEINYAPLSGRNTTEITDFDVERDRIALPARSVGDLDTNRDGLLDAGDHGVRVDAHGLTVDTSSVDVEHRHVTLTFDHLQSVPLDVFA
jgi:Ca2+-binding RTX toxin-like protein